MVFERQEKSQRSSSESRSAQDSGYFSPPSAVSLPKGGGAIKGMGEKFAANPVTGTASLSIPIATTPNRSDFYPKLSLSYDSGAGNGPFGFGWNLSVPSVTRKTDKGLPRYWDAQESDVFILSEAEDLVPIGESLPPQTLDGNTYTINRYRPRIEGLFARIERWQNRADVTDVFWKSVSKENVTSIYGRTENSRVADPVELSHIFKWLLCESYDDRGNRIIYKYKPENLDNVSRSQVQEKHRLEANAVSANRYLKFVWYGNQTPFKEDWLFQVVFDYSQSDVKNPEIYDPLEAPQPPLWQSRGDAFSNFRSGFEVRTYRLCSRVLMFHYLSEDGQRLDQPVLVRSTDLTYSQNPNDAPDPGFTYLTAVTQTGYVKTANGYRPKSMPKLELRYSSVEIQRAIAEVDSTSLENLPIGLDGTRYQWMDLDSEGLSGILTEQGDAWFYKRNLGSAKLTVPTDKTALPVTPATRTVEFASVELVATQPSTANLQGGQQQLMEIAGDGQKYLVQFSRPLPGYYRRDEGNQWENFTPFQNCPDINWNDPHLKFIDLNGDGFSDVLVAEDEVFTWYPSLGQAGFGTPEQVRKAQDDKTGPTTLVFADARESIYLADMDGDGLTDIVRIRNGEICYWPNKGYGRFGPKVTMANAPWFDYPDQFEQKRIRLGDIDGSGTNDVIYLGRDRVSLYFNQSGNGWSLPHTITNFPRVDDLSTVQVVDLLGNGTACLVWSSPLSGDFRRSLRYLDLMGGKKPHLLISMKNNIGMEQSMEYTASTRFYLEDRLAGTPWVTKLPFPVHVLTRVEASDTVTNTKIVSLYRYHHGYYDGVEREFRGFGLVEQWDTEYFPDSQTAFEVPPVYTKTWFHTGAYVNRQKISTHFEHEYYREPGETDQAFAASLLPDTILPAGLTAQEEREACRSLKGHILRQEIYALDGSKKQPHPYSVSERNYEIRLEQPLGTNRHAVFFAHDRETIDYHYERHPADPRITHAMTLEVDEFGNGLKSAAIAYPRRVPKFPEQGQIQGQLDKGKPLITYTENRVTNKPNGDLNNPNWYRIGVPIETRTYEITGLEVTGLPLFTPFSLDFIQTKLKEIETRLQEANPTPSPEITYEETPDGSLQRRLIEQVRSLYRPNAQANTLDPTSLPLGKVESLALPSESFKLAFTSGLLTQVYSSKIAASDLNALLSNEGKYVQQDGVWWIPSGRQAFDPDRFYLTIATIDPFGQTYRTNYDPYKLLPIQSEDPLKNIVQIENDYRVMQPKQITDPNGNRSQVRFDALGMVVGTAVMGKDNLPKEGDSFDDFKEDLTAAEIKTFFDADDPRSLAIQHLGTATTRIIYDLEQVPVCAAAIARKKHVSDLGGQPLQLDDIQVSFVYSDGFGRELQTKIQAEPGEAPLRNANGQLIKENGKLKLGNVDPRWVGTGRKIYNNKGKAVKQYEPFFSSTHQYESEADLVEWGVTPILFYDPLERVVATLHPNHIYEKVVFDPWQQDTWDVNDTVVQTAPNTIADDPKTDPDVGHYFKRLPDRDYLPTWHSRFSNSAIAAEREAAQKAHAHAGTPTTTHLDSLGRAFLTIARNGLTPQDEYRTHITLDIEGNQRVITDARNNRVMTQNFDLLSHVIHSQSVDAGARWMLNNVAGKPIRRWDSRNQEIQHQYDGLQRPTRLIVKQGTNQLLAEQVIYGETIAQPEQHNLRGKVYQQYDDAGRVTNQQYDFKGNLLRSSRTLRSQYQSQVNWSTEPDPTGETFTSETEYDALNRPIRLRTPYTNTIPASDIQPIYNEANLLEQVKVKLRGAQVETLFVQNIDYNAKGQRVSIEYENGAKTEYTYDPETFRLIRLHTTRTGNHSSSPLLLVNPNQLQDLRYTYDPMGNITEIRDEALPTITYDGEQVKSICRYTYDALYRLILAEGREHAGQNAYQPTTSRDNNRDYPFQNLPNANDPQAIRNYRESYQYDAVGNILEMVHRIQNGGWTRSYDYESGNNRLRGTSLPGDLPGTYSAQYDYDEHGSMKRMPQFANHADLNQPNLHWDFKDQLHQVDLGGGGTAYYVYDASGQRVRKVHEHQGATVEERLYLGGFELYRKRNSSGLTLERETLHIVDDQKRIALVETKTFEIDNNGKNQVTKPQPITLYQLDNHLGSASLELDEDGNVISYEEYHPYGTTAYQAGRSVAEVSLKRYRYTGKERDEESGLSYHGARYYAPWLGRWTSCDPAGMVDGSNLYQYSLSNPLRFNDPSGYQANNPLSDASRETLKKFVNEPKLSDASRETLEKFVNEPKFPTQKSCYCPSHHSKEVYSSGEIPGPIKLIGLGLLGVGAGLVIAFSGGSALAVIGGTLTLSGGISTTVVGVVAGGLTVSGKLTPEQERTITKYTLLTQQITSLGGLGGSVLGGLITGGNEKGVEKGASYGNLAEFGLSLGSRLILRNPAKTGGEVLLDTNVVYKYAKGRLKLNPGETPVITQAVFRELENNAARGGMSKPSNFGSLNLKVIADQGTEQLRLAIRQGIIDPNIIKGAALEATKNNRGIRGFYADGIIGATAFTKRMTLITGDKKFFDAFMKIGGKARFIQP